MSALLRYLAQGTLIAVPIAITLYVVVACVTFLDDLPQSYNVAGNLLAVPAACVAALDVKSSELMSFIVSGGIAGLGRNALPAAPRASAVL
jgi:uncharacterized membrane protein